MTLRLRIDLFAELDESLLLELLGVQSCLVHCVFVCQSSQYSSLASLAVDQLAFLLQSAVTQLDHSWPS